MGVNTKGIMSADVKLSDITNVLGYKFGVRAKVEDTYDPDYKQIPFTYRGEERILSVWEANDEIDNYIKFLANDIMTITVIDLELWGSAIELIGGIVEEFGGYIIEADIEGNEKYIEKII